MTHPRTLEALQAFVLHDERLRRLASIAQGQGRQVALVGGCVRDWLLGRPALDWDVVVEGDPMPLAKALQSAFGGPVVLLDAHFGVVRMRLAGGLTLDLTRMQGNTLEVDLTRRDLSINALAVSLEDGLLCDPTGGLADLERLTIRALGKGNLQADPLRLLRVYRFLATLEGKLDSQTAQWAAELAPLLEKPSGERVWAELSKLLAHPDGGRALNGLHAAGLLAVLFPAVRATDWEVSLQRLNALEGSLFALQSDFGASGAKTQALFDSPLTADRLRRAVLALSLLWNSLSGAPLDAAIARLKLSNKEAEWVRLLIENAPMLGSLEGACDLPLRLFRAQRDFKDAWPALVLRSLVTGALTQGFALLLLDSFWAWQEAPLKRFIGGHELSRLGVNRGPELGVMLVALDEAQATGQVNNPQEAVAWVTQRVISRE